MKRFGSAYDGLNRDYGGVLIYHFGHNSAMTSKLSMNIPFSFLLFIHGAHTWRYKEK